LQRYEKRPASQTKKVHVEDFDAFDQRANRIQKRLFKRIRVFPRPLEAPKRVLKIRSTNGMPEGDALTRIFSQSAFFKLSGYLRMRM
jgi:hypothetical protein